MQAPVRLLLLLVGLGIVLGEACQNGKPSCAVCQEGASAAGVRSRDGAERPMLGLQPGR